MKYLKFAFGVCVFLSGFGFVNQVYSFAKPFGNYSAQNRTTKAVEISTTASSNVVSVIPPVGASSSSVLIPNSSPVKITISSVGINALVLPVGNTSSGNMATPKNFNDVGWYKYGAIPGESGNSIIAGHFESGVNKNGYVKGGPFQNLAEVKIGDDIYVTGENGKKIHFVISSKKIYGKDENTKEIFSQKGEPKLVLITCNGAWLPNEKTFSKRLVVNAYLTEDNVN